MKTRILLALGLLTVLCACGQKGPLYRPAAEPAPKTPATGP